MRIKREGFDHILSKALTVGHTDVRLQWDPDHTPRGGPQKRRAIQLGLKNEVGVVRRPYVGTSMFAKPVIVPTIHVDAAYWYIHLF